MKKAAKTIWLCLGLISTTLLSGCYVAPTVLKLSPESEQTEWENGAELVWQTLDSVEVAIAFLGHREKLEFLVEIYNDGSTPLLVGPEQFFLSTTNNWEISALNPILELEQIDRRYAESKARSEATHGWDLRLIILDVVTDLATLDEPYSAGDAVVDAAVDIGLVSNAATREGERQKRHYLRNSREFWRFEALGKTTLHGGDQVSGIVLFPVPGEGDMVEVVIPIEGREFRFPYRITRSGG